MKQLPAKLGKEPLIDVVCAVTFDSEIPGSAVLPGVLLSVKKGKQPSLESLPTAQIPQEIRAKDPNLLNAPTVRIVTDSKFAVLIGDKTLAVGCLMPYVGWSNFKQEILDVFSILKDVPFVTKIERYALKYVDLFSNEQTPSSLSRFNLKLEVADRILEREATTLRTEIVEAPFVHAVSIISPAIVQHGNGSKIQGAVIEVDTHHQREFVQVEEFIQQLPMLLDNIHEKNKAIFFDLLSETGLNELEPFYE